MDLSFPEIFKYGLFYRPSEEAQDTYRTIVIDNLPSDITLAEVMQKVHGGLVVAADLLDTTALSDCMSVMIVFLHESSATRFTDYVSAHPLHFRGHRQARVMQLETPTWPLNPRLHRAIFDHGHTRCLAVRNLSSGITYDEFRESMKRNRFTKHDYIQSARKDSDGTIHVVFHSVHAAGWAYAKLTTSRDFGGCQVAFTPDPCSRPLETPSKAEQSVKYESEIATGTEANVDTHDVDAGYEIVDDTTTRAPTVRTVHRYMTTINSSGYLERKQIGAGDFAGGSTDIPTHTTQTSPKTSPTFPPEAKEDLLIDLTPMDEPVSSASSIVSSDKTSNPNGTLHTLSRSRGASTTTVTVVPPVSTVNRCREANDELTISQTMTSAH